MDIVVLDGYTENPGDLSWEGFERLGRLTVYDRTPPNDEKEIQKRIGEAEAIFTNKTPIGKSTLEACPKIKYIGVLATGYDVVDLGAAKDFGVPVTNIPAYSTDAVAQMAIALLLEICHHAGAHSESVHNGDWSKCADVCYWNYPLIELAGKTVGIIGFGRIGQKTAQIAKALGMEVIAFDEYPNDSGKALGKYVSLDELFAAADIISLHCPLSSTNRGFIGKEAISKMKDGVILINTARGALVADQDLADALNSGKIAWAGLDVVSVEPIRPDNPLLSAKNCIITPHIAWAPRESRKRLMDIAVENLKAFLNGCPVNVVNGL